MQKALNLLLKAHETLLESGNNSSLGIKFYLLRIVYFATTRSDTEGIYSLGVVNKTLN